MANISICIPHYNDQQMLKHCILNLADKVDQIVIMDGGPDGVSKPVIDPKISNIGNVDIKIYKGTYIANSGIGWDRKSQIKDGFGHLDGEYVGLMSADMIMHGELDRKIVEDSDMCYSRFIDFWIDSKHIKSSHDSRNIGLSPFIWRKELSDFVLWGEKLREIRPKDLRTAYFDCLVKFHFGWLRPFHQQVEKHLRNVKMGLWGDIGEKIQSESTRVQEAWAIHHALKYGNEPVRVIKYDFPKCSKELLSMTCWNGLEEYKEKYFQRYKMEFYSGIMSSCPIELARI